MEFTIDRKKWIRGTCVSLLSDGHGNYDIMGHYLKSVGIDEELLRKKYSPREVPGSPSWLLSGRNSSKLSSKIMRKNDSVLIEDEVREKELKKLFKQVGIRLKFIN